MARYLITGATGQLGIKVVEHLSTIVPREDIVALVRSDRAAADFADKGIATRRGDYDDKALAAALEGVDRLLLISSPAVGQRARQHGNAIAAAKDAGVSFIAYTSLLNAPLSGMALAEEHIATEKLLRDSGIPHTLLRNGWYTENLTISAMQDIQLGKHFGTAKDGEFSSASRQDFAEAAAIVLAGGHDGEVLELAGDTGITLTDYATQLSAVAGKLVEYVDMPEDAYKAALVQAGLPASFAAVLADTHAKAAQGWLRDESKTLSRLIGRPTTPVVQTIKSELGETG